ncbi:MAG: restriction endonuclease [Gammaproteobacteria bacterium]|nr:restriction endonuclease [Gammaproteobacteria bacterium]MXY88968.1 restriction endonuclease [Gammaproteobacteria bacterium]MYA36567.1 restriction endonuclease [Gammaproteobacteria bacterium]MYC60445.1 restriction endonuclease [Gammaproteobacteria bacterium]MYF00674.1 restriction endonuclease [Gammaproteobacteria bacterium]
MKDFVLAKLASMRNGYSVCGLVDRRGRVYPLGSDTKVIGAVFEIVTRQVMAAYADEHDLILLEPKQQNFYPDFTLMRGEDDPAKIAVDVKTTYRRSENASFSFTLGSYTSFLNPETESKNIVFPYSEYKQHWIIGFVYRRIEGKRAADASIYSFDELQDIDLPFDDVSVFVQEKWRIAGKLPGSGNTANIGSLRGQLEDFEAGNGVFSSEEEFEAYWREKGALRRGR